MKVIMVAASTICGRIGPSITGSKEDRVHLERLRDDTGASLMGAATLRLNDPEMRGSNGRLPENRLRAFLTASGRVPLKGKKIYKDGPAPIIFTSQQQKDNLAEKVNGQVELVALQMQDGALQFRGALDYLDSRGVRSVLVEGGGQLNYHALRENIVDEIYLTLLPKISGDQNGAGLVSGPFSLGNPCISLELLSHRHGSYGEIFLHYRVIYQEDQNGQ